MATLLIKRYLWLIELLRRNPSGLTLAEINAEWQRSSHYKDCGETDISRRTFLNHCYAIADQLDIQIKCVRSGANSHYKIETANDSQYRHIEWLLSSIATEELITNCKNISDKIILEAPDTGTQYLSPITKALRDNTVLCIDYKSFHIGSMARQGILVEPLCLKMFKRRWYLLCRHSTNKKFRIYALDRFNRCELTSTHFTYPPNFAPQEYFAPFYGISTDGYTEKPCRIVLKAYQELPQYLISQPLHYSQEIKEQTSDYTVFEYWLIPAFDFVQEIFLHAEQLEVLEPASLREILKQKSHRLTSLYQ